MNNQKTCQERVQEHFESRIDDLEILFKNYQEGKEEADEDLGKFYDYGLCFDYVPADDKGSGFFRYQLSTGGPGDEFRFFVDLDYEVYKIEYWVLDWYDGAHVLLTGKSFDFMREIYDFFNEIGSCKVEFEKNI